ncbi:MAG: ATP synthase F1 subunit delta [Acidobacteria bacterium]|nr:ATP synthase F1 subunit delta [Acidobacteriota bacterium]
MNIEILARRYAKALLSSLASPSEYAPALSDLKKVDALIASNKELRDALFHPTFPKTKKADILSAILAILKPVQKVDRFCMAVVERGRIIMFSEMVKAVEREWDRRQKIVEVEISTAVPLKSTQRQRLEAELSRITGSKLKPIYKLDSAILGGIVTRIGTTCYDGSLKGQLQRIRQQLAEG